MNPFECYSNDCSCWQSRILKNARLKSFYNRYMLLSDKGTAWQKHIPFLLSKGVDLKHFKGLEKSKKALQDSKGIFEFPAIAQGFSSGGGAGARA